MTATVLAPADRYRVFNEEHALIQTAVTLADGQTINCYADYDGLLRQLRVERGRTIGDPQIDPEVAEIFAQGGWLVRPYDGAEPDEEVVAVYGGNPFAVQHLADGPRGGGIDTVGPQVTAQAARIAVLEAQNEQLMRRLDLLQARLDAGPAPRVPTPPPTPPLPPAPTVAELTGKGAKAKARPAGRDDDAAGDAPAGRIDAKADALAGIPHAR